VHELLGRLEEEESKRVGMEAQLLALQASTRERERELQMVCVMLLIGSLDLLNVPS
jgi:hypothetical protein